MIAAVLCRRLLLFKQPYIMGVTVVASGKRWQWRKWGRIL